MGFFSKLFGLPGEGSNGPLESVNVIPTADVGGYNKEDFLMCVDMYNTYLNELEQAVKAKGEGRVFSCPKKPLMPEMRKTRRGGFSETEVEAYLSELDKKTAELKSRL